MGKGLFSTMLSQMPDALLILNIALYKCHRDSQNRLLGIFPPHSYHNLQGELFVCYQCFPFSSH